VTAFALHQLVVETSSSLPDDPGALLLAGFPPPEPGGHPRLTLRFEGAIAPLRPPPGPSYFTNGDVTVHLDGGAPLVAGPGTRLRVSPRGDRIDGWLTAEAAACPREVADVETMLALALALGSHGIFHLHAAATVSAAGQVLAIAGTGGAGKSTLAGALAGIGHGYLGDDVVLVGQDGALLAFPRPFHLSPASARALGLATGPPRPGTGKGDLDGQTAFPGRFRWFAPPPDLLLLPEVADRPDTALSPVTRADALGALLSLSAFAASTLPGAEAQRARLAGLVDGARPVRVALGRDLLEDAAATASRLDAALARLR
jgi:hypothetical protein